ncbi:hypothetical protein [Streptomyces sp. NPDC018059]|uniref:hypothetical protein n=1 Tax=Streptomyces sp. NPDC018059 TaxID=3365041 RepID=UPI003793C818
MQPTRFEWESSTVAQAARDLAAALAHIESLNPAKCIACHVVVDLEPGAAPAQQEGETP